MSGSALTTSLLGAFQASLSVLLTLSYGVLAARMKLLSPATARDISSLCATLFLPALLLTNIGSNLSPSNVTNYVPVLLWSVAYALISALLGKAIQMLGGKHIPDWVLPACTFNNTTSLPLLLTEALASTGVLKGIVVGGEDVGAAVERAKSYFLVNSMVSNAATFAVGPKLLDARENDDDDDEDGDQTEESPLLPRPVAAKVKAAEDRIRTHFHALPTPVQRPLKFLGTLINPTLIGAFVAVTVGLIPALRTLLFADFQDGGYFNAWLTSSLKNIGDLFTALQMFVVGSKLNSAFFGDDEEDEEEEEDGGDGDTAVGYAAFWSVFAVRFVFWGAVSTPLIYALAKRGVLDSDPILWFAMAMMPVGPPAMILSALTDVAGLNKTGKLQVARMLGGMYIVSPIIFLQVVAACKMAEKVLAERG
ncbi:membrane transport protein-domain-containing protein [Geopyxis carbonaria]|nr:membrane transport protein-domain-containing protein [Geopyxis carbonaria]